MPADYRMWIAATGPGYCRLARIQNYDEPWNLRRGHPLQGRIAPPARYSMDPRDPRAIQLADCIENPDGTIIASRRVAELLQAREIRGVEYLPVTITNHRGRVASSDYLMVNVVAIQDCLDLARSKPRYNPINPEDIDQLERLVLDESKIEPTLPLFRCKDFYGRILVAPQLAAALEPQAFVGLWLTPITEYRS